MPPLKTVCGVLECMSMLGEMSSRLQSKNILKRARKFNIYWVTISGMCHTLDPENASSPILFARSYRSNDLRRQCRIIQWSLYCMDSASYRYRGMPKPQYAHCSGIYSHICHHEMGSSSRAGWRNMLTGSCKGDTPQAKTAFRSDCTYTSRDGVVSRLGYIPSSAGHLL